MCFFFAQQLCGKTERNKLQLSANEMQFKLTHGLLVIYLFIDVNQIQLGRTKRSDKRPWRRQSSTSLHVHVHCEDVVDCMSKTI